MKRMGSSNVLVAGLKGLGVEIGECCHLLDTMVSRI